MEKSFVPKHHLSPPLFFTLATQRIGAILFSEYRIVVWKISNTFFTQYHSAVTPSVQYYCPINYRPLDLAYRVSLKLFWSCSSVHDTKWIYIQRLGVLWCAWLMTSVRPHHCIALCLLFCPQHLSGPITGLDQPPVELQRLARISQPDLSSHTCRCLCGGNFNSHSVLSLSFYRAHTRGNGIHFQQRVLQRCDQSTWSHSNCNKSKDRLQPRRPHLLLFVISFSGHSFTMQPLHTFS